MTRFKASFKIIFFFIFYYSWSIWHSKLSVCREARVDKTSQILYTWKSAELHALYYDRLMAFELTNLIYKLRLITADIRWQITRNHARIWWPLARGWDAEVMTRREKSTIRTEVRNFPLLYNVKSDLRPS
jgi:hypothetical protein